MYKFLIVVLSIIISPLFPLLGALVINLTYLELNINRTADPGVVAVISLSALAQILWLVAIFTLGVQL